MSALHPAERPTADKPRGSNDGNRARGPGFATGRQPAPCRGGHVLSHALLAGILGVALGAGSPAETEAQPGPGAPAPQPASEPAPLIPFPTGPVEQPAAWSHLPAIVRAKTISLDFRGADIDNVLRFYSMAAGVTIAKASGLKGPVTLINARPLALEEAFRILDGVLRGLGYQLEWESPLLRVMPVSRQSAPPSFSFPTGGRSSEPETPASEIRVFPLKHADAQQVARVLSELFPGRSSFLTAATTPVAGGFGPGGFGPGGFGPGGQMPGGLAPGAGPTDFGPGGSRFGRRAGSSAGSGASGSDVRAAADTYTNSVLVNAPTALMGQVESVVKELDRQVPPTMQMRVFPLQCASASAAATIVTSILASSSSRRQGTTTTAQYVPFERRVRGGGSAASSGSSGERVVADERTNSLFVTATPEGMAVVEEAVKQLDQPVKARTTTYVYPMANARASEVATLLNQVLRSLGSTSGTSSTSAQRGSGHTTTSSSQYSRPSSVTGRSASPGAEAAAESAGSRAAMLPGAPPDAQPAGAGPAGPGAAGQVSPSGQPGTPGGGSGYAAGSGSPALSGRTDEGQWVSLLSMNGQANIVADTNTNSLIISTTPENYAALEEVIRQLDVIPEQVLIEAVVVEAALDATTKLGVEWSWTRTINDSAATLSTSLPDADLSGSPRFRFSVAGQALQAAITALSTDSRFNVLSTPRIFTANNREAQINISQQVPYVTSTSETEAGTIRYNYGYLDVGLVLTVTPHITKSGLVTVEVTQTANELQGYTTFNAPKVSQRSANTTITIRDGETIILGGMIRDQKDKVVNKVPVLGSLPLIGGLFRSTSDTTSKTELMVFLTPRIVRDADQAVLLTQEQKRQVNVVIPPPAGALPGAGQPAAGLGPEGGMLR